MLHSSERFFDKEAFLEVGLNVSLTLLLIMDLSSQFGTVPVQFPCKTMMRTPQSLGLLPRFMFHGSKIEVYSHEKEALLSRYSSVQITVVISTLAFDFHVCSTTSNCQNYDTQCCNLQPSRSLQVGFPRASRAHDASPMTTSSAMTSRSLS